MHAETADTYDFIVVGAGSAGAVLAARLSEDDGARTLLLDAGSDRRSLLVTVPGGVKFMLGNPRYDRRPVSEADPLRAGKTVQWAASRIVGGGSAINGSVYNRGLARDFDDWAADGCGGWSAADVLPLFRSIESWRGPLGPTRGAHGPLGVEYNRFDFPLLAPFLAACAEAGLPVVDDINAFPEEGIGRTQASTRRGARQSTRNTFLKQALARPNLTLQTESTVTRLLIENGRCIGVEVERHGKRRRIHAVREVILSAGALATPTLLLRSGIGPADELRALEIPVVRDLPGVGRNLQDHAGVGYATAASIRTISAMEMKPWRIALNGLRWLVRRDGPAAGASVLGSGVVRSSSDEPEPDIFVQFTAVSMAASGAAHDFAAQGGFTTFCSVARPRSRGRLTLRSADPAAPPRIELSLIGDADDRRRLIAGLRLLRRIHGAPALAPYALGERLPGADHESDADLERYVIDRAATQYHLSGTCRMGTGPDAVVDPALRVRGIDGLRIADASIIPRITSANINAPVMMIGAKAASLILANRRHPPGDPS